MINVQKCPLLWCCFVTPTSCSISPILLSLYGKPWGLEKILRNIQIFTHFSHQRNLSFFLITYLILGGGKVSLIDLRQVLPTVLSAACILSYTIMTYLEKIDGTMSLNTKQCPTRIFSSVIPQVSPPFKKCPLLWCCFIAPNLCVLSPFPWTYVGNPRDGKSPTQKPKI